jgi:hypothetical protein
MARRFVVRRDPPTQRTSDFFRPSSVSFGSFVGACCTYTGISISPRISSSTMNEAMWVPVAWNVASSITSVSTVRSIDPFMWRASGPQRWTVRPEGSMNRISSVTRPFATFHARNSTNGNARPGAPER